MRVSLYAQWWRDQRHHEMRLIDPVTLTELGMIMKYGSVTQDTLELGPFDVSNIDNLKLVIRMEPE